MVNPRLTNILVEILEVNEKEVTPNLAMGITQSWDSLRHIELVFRIEETFNVRFRAEVISKITSVELIQKALEENGIT